MEKKVFDFKKEYSNLYQPKDKPMLIDVTEATFIMVDGKGDPNNNPHYQEAISILYALSYAIKMSKMGKKQLDGYFDFVVPPLEGLWWVDGDTFDLKKRDNWLWTAMIRQPEFVMPEVFLWALNEAKKKYPELDFSKARLEKFREGLCVQAMHTGPYSTEPETVERMQEFMAENNLHDDVGNIRKHHEIYLSDPRKTEIEKLKTILRHPVSKLEGDK